MENSIIKADIKCKFSKAFSVIVYLLLGLSIVWLIPVSTELYVSDIFSYSTRFYFNLIKASLFYTDYSSSGGQSTILEDQFIIGIVVFILIFVVAALKLYTQDVTKECSIELTSEGINGRRKRIGAKADLRLPIEKIDSLFVTETIFDKIRGGKTLGIRSNTGVIRFVCVQNADEFVAAANKAIEENKKSNKAIPAPSTTVVQNTSNADELKKYKDLLDSGVITQEEFDAKKKQLLGL